MIEYTDPKLSEFESPVANTGSDNRLQALTAYQPGDTVKIITQNVTATVIDQHGTDVRISYQFEPNRAPEFTSVPAVVLERVKDAPTPASRGIRILSVAELMALPAPEWTVFGVLPKAGLAILFGAPGSGKTFIALDIAAAIASGTLWHDQETRAGAVAYIAAEGFRGLRNRLIARFGELEGDALETAHRNFDVVEGVNNLVDEAQFQELLQKLKARHQGAYALLVIDTLARAVQGLEENSAMEMGLLIQRCDALRQETGATVLLVHHSTKASDEVERGSSALSGAVDAKFVVKKAEHCITLICMKQKDDEALAPKEFSLDRVSFPSAEGSSHFEHSCVLRAFVKPTVEVRTEDDSSQPTLGRNETLSLDAIRESGTDVGLTSKEVLERSKLKRTPVLAALKSLQEKGYVIRVNAGKRKLYKLDPSKNT